MSILSTPLELISHGGAAAVSGAIILAAECLIFFLFALVIRRLIIFSGKKEVKISGRVIRKYVVPEHRKWQGKASVTVLAQNALEIEVENRFFQFLPVSWKYDRISEGDQIDVAIQRGRIGNEIRIVDIGPF
ncbi:hypothetical protein [Caballeronia sp. LZ035]|uniref:hypothetical protein n=1 Tax=Caballeronia sp. LZ035 TaxID=3038568 RepID=UPI00285A5893|nr:hypothetical protein [Caballeronia sp. LZ035]MDR5762502.1 hypothetical protein [Caballeronia sp. LZ035]